MPQDRSAAAGSGSREVRGVEQPEFAIFEAKLQIRDGSIHHLVLFRTPTRSEAALLLEKANCEDLRSLRGLTMISVLLGCGLRRAELPTLTVDDMQIRQEHWAIVDLVGKAVIFGRCRCPIGSKRRSTIGWPQTRSTQAGSFEPLAVTVLHGVKASPRTSYGTGRYHAYLHPVRSSVAGPVFFCVELARAPCPLWLCVAGLQAFQQRSLRPALFGLFHLSA